MAQYNVKVDFDTLNQIGKSVEEYSNQLVQILSRCDSLMIDLERSYNTPNSKILNSVIREYLNDRQQYVKTRYNPVKDKITSITNEYSSFSSDISSIVNK